MSEKSEIQKILPSVLTGLVIVSGLLYYFYTQDLLGAPKNLYFAKYKNVQGITTSSEVQIKGLKVGEVYDILFTKGNDPEVIVSFDIDNPKLKIPVGSVLQIASSDLLSDKILTLSFNDTNAYHIPGDTLLSSPEEGAEKMVNEALEPIKQKTDKLKFSFDSAATIFKGLKDEADRQKLLSSFDDIKEAMDVLDHLMANVDTISYNEKIRLAKIDNNLTSIQSNLNDNDSTINLILANYNQITDSIAKGNIDNMLESSARASQYIDEITDQVNSSNGTVGILLNDTTLTSILAEAEKDFELLLSDIDAFPERYVTISMFPKRRKKGSDDLLTKEQKESLKRILEGKKNGNK